MAGKTVAGRRHKTWESRYRAAGGGSGDRTGQGTGWDIVSYLLAGLVAYGGIGWVAAHFTHIGLFFPIGMAFGIAVSLGWVVYRYGRQ